MIPAPYSLGETFLGLALLLFCLDLILLSAGGKLTPIRQDAAAFASMQGCLFVAASYLLLSLGFVTNAFFLEEVYSSSSSSLDWAFRAGGPWISGNGSLLFITLLLSLLYLGYRRGLSGPAVSPFRSVVYRALDIFLMVLLLVSLLQSPFSGVFFGPPDGVGLSPLLQTFWVLIHPPVIFLGYALVFFAFALRAAARVTGDTGQLRSRWYTLSLPGAWLFLALGIALGGYWSYVVLGWGGYWAWDPVETASLLPWLALTAFFHVPSPADRRLQDLLLAATFSLVLYATAVTRGGFSPSLHAFGASPAGYLFLGIAVVSSLAFLFLRGKDAPHAPLPDADRHSLHSLCHTVAFASVLAILSICFIGVTLPVLGGLAGIPFSVGGAFFTTACFPFALALAAAFIGCGGTMTRQRFAGILLFCLAAGALGSLLMVPVRNPLADFGLPLLAVSGGILLVRLASYLSSGRFSARVVGKSVIHFAIVLILLGVLVSSGAETETVSVPVQPGSSVEIHGTLVTVTDISLFPGTGQVYYPSHGFPGPEHAGLVVQAQVEDGEIRTQRPIRMAYYPLYGMVSLPTVISTPGRDLYLSVHPTADTQERLTAALMGMEASPGEVILSAKVVPFIALVWAGTALLVTGMGFVLAGAVAARR